MGTSSGELRELLVTAIEAVRDGKLAPDEAKAIAALAQQVHLSLQVEINAKSAGYMTGKAIGALALGDERSEVIDA